MCSRLTSTAPSITAACARLKPTKFECATSCTRAMCSTGRCASSTRSASRSSTWLSAPASRTPGIFSAGSKGQSRRPVTQPAKTRVSVRILSTAWPVATMLSCVVDGLNGISTTWSPG